MNIYLPLHVWDREFDSRLAISYFEACKGNTVLIGHEYNMSPFYRKDRNSLLFRAGQPLDHSTRGAWHQDVKERGGIVITHDEEGINNLPFIFETRDKKKFAKLDINKIKKTLHNASPKAFKNVSTQIAWSNLHRACQCHQITNIESRSIAINRIEAKSSVRFDLLGSFGEKLNKRLINSIQNIYGNYVLILDNFSVDHRGQRGMVDPTKDLRQAGYSEEEIKDHINELMHNTNVETKARKDFTSLIISIAKENPSIHFIFRPHPVLDPRYWQEVFSSIQNISLAERGPIHAWIYGAVATIHSGCTTGLEAYAADKTTFDVSALISERSSTIATSLIGQSIKEIRSAASLKNKLRKLWSCAMGNDKNIKVERDEQIPNLINTEMTEEIRMIEIDNALKLIEENSALVADRIQNGIKLSNGSEVIGGESALTYIVKRSNQIRSAEQSGIDLSSLKDLSGNLPPNPLKSRYATKQEVCLRLDDFRRAFLDHGITLPNTHVEEIGVNCFLIKRKANRD